MTSSTSVDNACRWHVQNTSVHVPETGVCECLAQMRMCTYTGAQVAHYSQDLPDVNCTCAAVMIVTLQGYLIFMVDGVSVFLTGAHVVSAKPWSHCLRFALQHQVHSNDNKYDILPVVVYC
jgi:hypothetical protein